MKKWVIILFMFVGVTNLVNGIPVVDLGMLFEMGHASHPFGTYTTYPKNNEQPSENNFYTIIQAKGQLYNFLFIEGNVNTQMFQNSNIYTFEPTFVNYFFKTGITYNGYSIYYHHECTHPITTYQINYYPVTIIGEGYLDKFAFNYTSSHYYKYGEDIDFDISGYNFGYLLEVGIANGTFGKYEVNSNNYSNFNSWFIYYTEMAYRLWLLDTLYTGGSVTFRLPDYNLNTFYITNTSFEFGIRCDNFEVFFEKEWASAGAARTYQYRISSLREAFEGITKIGLRYNY